ncbi:MAG: VOC family protein [Chloroflexota bacterium]
MRPDFIEILRLINHPALSRFLEEHGAGLHHVAYAVDNLSQRIEDLNTKGVFAAAPFVAGTGWKIAYFDLEKSGLELFHSHYHGDHLAEADEE